MSGSSPDNSFPTWPHELTRADGGGPYHPPAYKPANAALRWLEDRLPILGFLHGTAVSYPTPRNLNYLWTFGAILTFMLMVQIVTGIVLVMHYTPDAGLAFDSVEHIMRDVNYGWLLRYLHSNGASMFFFAVYVHIFRGMYYGSYKSPREVLWILGVIIYLLMIATGFMGYVLPWGQMSYWAATVITNLFSAIPVVGDTIVTWLWGGFSVGNPTLQRFFSLHYLLPFAILGVVVLHIWALHVVGQNNPAGVDPKTDKETVPFTPHATLKDAFFLALFAIAYAWFTFEIPNFTGHADNYIPANPAVTPSHIVPEWYYLPFYAILRSIPNKLLGVVAMFSSIAILLFLPWLDTSRVKSAAYRPLFKQCFWLFVLTCVLLGWLGSKPPEGGYVILSRLLTAWYFLYFLVVLPVLGLIERPKPVPNSISDALKGGKAAAAIAVVLAVGAAGLVGLAAVGRRAGARRTAAAPQRVVVCRPVRQIRYRAAAARLQGLSRGMPDLSWPDLAVVSQSRPSGRAGVSARAGRGDRGGIHRQGWAERSRRHVRPSGPPGGPFSAAVPERTNRAPRPWRRPAARHVGPCQGAPIRTRISLVSGGHGDSVSGTRRRLYRGGAQGLCPEARRHDNAFGYAVQRLLPRPCDRHAAAA